MICMLNRSAFELQDKLGRTLMASEASDTNYFLKRHLQSLPTFSDVSLSLITCCREKRELKIVNRYTKMAVCLFNVDQHVSKAPWKPNICKQTIKLKWTYPLIWKTHVKSTYSVKYYGH